MTAPSTPARRFAGRPQPGGSTPTPVRDVLAAGSSTRVRAGRLWLVQAVTGGALVAFLGLHLVAQHFLAPGGLRDFASVVDYLRQPLVALAELGLVASVVVHAGLGVRGAIVEIVPDGRVRRLATSTIVVAAVAIIAYAAVLTWRLATWPT